MRALKFKLSGATAFFKKPDVNSFAYFTYGHIHKIAVLGILGSVLGLGGYAAQAERKKGKRAAGKKAAGKNTENTDEYPEFYQVLKGGKISILPQKGYFTKKLQVFNNSVGYASREKGGNLITREQWLENPCWHIYVLEDGLPEEVFSRLGEYMTASRCVYMPYLGKNDHSAVIEECGVVELKKAGGSRIDSIFIKGAAVLGENTLDEDELEFWYSEVMPVGLNGCYNFYEFEQLMMTNRSVSNVAQMPDVYECGGRVLAFF
ncbi:CRISPR-associated protein Cas5h [Anaerobacterium chartisolvens]|uniref:CRISPR-associated protein Cas5h n=1 Tax=Anaerobacterium chartisolvens TaxID=1297424 RepID=A0A369AUE4_9FIRM|nr:type I-B CRISPR-associated protein Cas5b [Anaerobacterium chartisolvens]RCX12705.1 CRISPR-associated protein Cas5h [Anaerobacterium chartisolvens]